MNEAKLQELALSLGTPSFVFDTDILTERARWIAGTIRPAKLCFAMKANPFLVKTLEGYVER